MNLIDSKVELIPQSEGIDGLYKHIELIGRVCTKSEDKITESSAEKFVQNMRKLNHGAVLEHGTIYLTIPFKTEEGPNNELTNIWSRFYSNPYSVCKADNQAAYITTNYRALLEEGSYCLRYLKYMTPPTEHHEERITLHFTLSRAIANEFVRHRHFSFMQESTRYVNYAKKELEFIYPEWLSDDEESALFIEGLKTAENAYKQLIKANLNPQDARDILPLATKTELYMTGTMAQWGYFLSLRSPKYGATGVHPDAAKLADRVYDLLKDKLQNNDE